MTNTYPSGRKRVHATGPSSKIRDAIVEYVDYALSPKFDRRLAIDLLETVEDLAAELRLRIETTQAKQETTT